MRNQKAQIENAANTTKTFHSDHDGNGLYEISFYYKKNIGSEHGYLVAIGTCTLEASTKAEALEIFESLPATKTINRLKTAVKRIEHGIIWNMNA